MHMLEQFFCFLKRQYTGANLHLSGFIPLRETNRMAHIWYLIDEVSPLLIVLLYASFPLYGDELYLMITGFCPESNATVSLNIGWF